MRIAVCYDWLDSYGGAERVVKVLVSKFPQAEIFALVKSGKVEWLAGKKVHVSWLNKGSWLRKRGVLTLLGGWTWQSMNFGDFDLVICVTSDQARWIRHPKLICVCLTPPRHWWSLFGEYCSLGGWTSRVLALWGTVFRVMDFYQCHKVCKILAISTEVQQRIRRYYGLEVAIIYPPVEKLG